VLATEAELVLLGLDAGDEQIIYTPRGCERCNYSGYRGRSGIYEMIEVDSDLRRLIHEGAGEQEMLEEARRRYPGILEDGRRRVLSGETSMKEVLRVTTSN
jgi:general secretion pathway protein E